MLSQCKNKQLIPPPPTNTAARGCFHNAALILIPFYINNFSECISYDKHFCATSSIDMPNDGSTKHCCGNHVIPVRQPENDYTIASLCTRVIRINMSAIKYLSCLVVPLKYFLKIAISRVSRRNESLLHLNISNINIHISRSNPSKHYS